MAVRNTVVQAGRKKKTEIPTTINLQAYGKSISGEELIEMAKQAWVDTGHELDMIKSLDIYIKITIVNRFKLNYVLALTFCDFTSAKTSHTADHL